jgi:hypothetical protein
MEKLTAKKNALARLFMCGLRLRDMRDDPGWVAAMTAVELHSTWERYAERRLALALYKHPATFLASNNMNRMRKIPLGLASALVRGGRYFDFRSTGDLIKRGTELVGEVSNPFRKLPTHTRKYLDALASMRNHIVHESDHARSQFNKRIAEIYGAKQNRHIHGFLSAVDNRADSPANGKPRIVGLMKIVKDAIEATW